MKWWRALLYGVSPAQAALSEVGGMYFNTSCRPASCNARQKVRRGMRDRDRACRLPLQNKTAVD